MNIFGLDNPDHPRLYRILNGVMLPYTTLPYDELCARVGERSWLAAPGDRSDMRRIHIQIRRASYLADAVEVRGSIRPDGPPWLARPAHNFVKRANGWWSGSVHEGDEPSCRARLPGDPKPPRPEDYLPPSRLVRLLGAIPITTPVLIGAGLLVLGAVAGVVTLMVAAVGALL